MRALMRALMRAVMRAEAGRQGGGAARQPERERPTERRGPWCVDRAASDPILPHEHLDMQGNYRGISARHMSWRGPHVPMGHLLYSRVLK